MITELREAAVAAESAVLEQQAFYMQIQCIAANAPEEAAAAKEAAEAKAEPLKRRTSILEVGNRTQKKDCKTIVFNGGTSSSPGPTAAEAEAAARRQAPWRRLRLMSIGDGPVGAAVAVARSIFVS